MRNEAVRLSLQDDFTSGVAKAAAATALLNRELNRLSGQAVATSRVTQNITRDNDALARSANRSDASINQLTGRLRLLVDAAATLGPALIPVGALAVPAVAGLANQLGAAALAGGTAILAFQGVGEALKAVNAAAVEPTAANLQKAEDALSRLSPAAQELVANLEQLRPVLTSLRDAAAGGLFPGVNEALDSLQTRVPEVQRIIGTVSATLGQLLSAGAADLASPRWDAFLAFLATDVPRALAALGSTIGSLTRGMAELWMAFAPLNDGFSTWMVDVARGFEQWAAGLARTQGFADFLGYVRSTGPQVADTLLALGDAFLQIVEAAAPIGGPVLRVLEVMANVVAKIADSDLGTPIMAGVAAMALLSRATATYRSVAATTFATGAVANIRGMGAALLTTTTAQDRARLSVAQYAQAEQARSAAIRTGMATIGKAAGVVGGLAIATSGVADKVGLSNTASLALMGTLAGPWGSVIGGAAGAAMDLGSAFSTVGGAAQRAKDAIASGSIPAMIQSRTELRRMSADITAWRGPDAVIDGLQKLAGKADDAQAQIDSLNYALRMARAPSGQLAGVFASSLAPAIGSTRRQFELAGSSAADFTRQLAVLNGFLDRRQALRNYDQALRDFAQSVRANGVEIGRMNPKAAANQEKLDAIARSAGVAAQQLRGMNRVDFLKNTIADITQLAKKLGVPLPAIQAVIDKLKEAGAQRPKPNVTVGGILASMNGMNRVNDKFNVLDRLSGGPTVTVGGVQSGIAGLVALQARINALRDRTVTITTRRVGGPAPMTGFADGGVYERPRIGDQPPQIRSYTGPAGLTWSEEGSGPWEAFISGHPAKRARSRMLLGEVADRLGGEVMWRAADGLLLQRPTVTVTTASSGPTDRSTTFAFNGPIQTVDVRALAREIETRWRDTLTLALQP